MSIVHLFKSGIKLALVVVCGFGAAAGPVVQPRIIQNYTGFRPIPTMPPISAYKIQEYHQPRDLKHLYGAPVYSPEIDHSSVFRDLRRDESFRKLLQEQITSERPLLGLDLDDINKHIQWLQVDSEQHLTDGEEKKADSMEGPDAKENNQLEQDEESKQVTSGAPRQTDEQTLKSFNDRLNEPATQNILWDAYKETLKVQ